MKVTITEDTKMKRMIWPRFILNCLPVIFHILAIIASCKGATDFCNQSLGMERWIIADDQITASTTYNIMTHSAKEARLNNGRSWLSRTGTAISDQWVKVDLKKPMSITGIKIQGDPVHPPNYITKFKLDYNYDGGTVYYDKMDTTSQVKVFIGGNGQNQLISNSFLLKAFTARFVRFRPKEIGVGGNDVSVRFELDGCAYVCNTGLGIEHGVSLPSGVLMDASSAEYGKEALNGRLSGPSSWCANTNSAHEYLQIDFGKVVTMSGLAIQGDPLQNSWVKDFYIYYGTELTSLEVYSEEASTKLFIGSKDQNTIVVHWFKVRLTARYLRLKPNQYNGKKCLRIEVIGCESAFVGEVGAESRVLEDSRFLAYNHFEWIVGRYRPKDGRLNNDRPWGNKRDRHHPWFKVDLGRIMLVNGVSTQGDPTYGSNYFPDYKLEFSLQDNGVIVIDVKEEDNSSDKVFAGNTNNMGVKFNFLKKNPISARHLQFRENTMPLNDYCLRIEIYAYPQVCSESFGLIVGEPSKYHPRITASGGVTPSSKAKLNSIQAWCGTGNSVSILYDLGSEKQVNGIAIQGNPAEDKWIKTFKVQYGSSTSSLTTYQVSGVDKVFVGCNSRNLIVYNWFSSEITTRYLKIIPTTFKSQACLRLNIYGCPALGCFKPVGIQSSAIIANFLLTSSTSGIGNEAYKCRLNTASAWSACQVGSCSPKEVVGSKPWIQLCLATSHMITGLVIQGFGQIEDLAHVLTFTIKYSFTIAGKFYDYKINSTEKAFVASTGRYGSKQINFPRALAARCVRLVVQSQSSTSKNVGLRWEVLGCTPASSRVAVSLQSASYTVARGLSTTITCTGVGQPGLAIIFLSSWSPVVESSTHNMQAQIITNDNILGSTTRSLRITALGPEIAASYRSCILSNETTGQVRCHRIYDCSARYPGVASSLDSKSFTVQVTGLIGKPQPPTRLRSSNITQTSVKISWNASVGSDFPVAEYKASIYRKKDGVSAAPEQKINSIEVTFSGLTSSTVYIIEVSGKSARFSIYSEKQTLSFRTSLTDICKIHEPCKNNATCTNQVVEGYKCHCTPGYTGKNCTIDNNECKSNPCSANGKCIDEVNRYKCVCEYLFTGQNCENRMDPCKIANCYNGTCISKNVSYSCNCYAGYTGMYCRTDIDECSMKPRGICQNGKCISGNGTISCSCFAGYSGPRCDIDQWPCRRNPCLQGGKCTNGLENGFSCNCPTSYGGTRCEKKLEQCNAKPCKNGGICKHVEQNDQFVFECGCKEGYGGTFCEYNYGDSSLSVVVKLAKSQAFNETAFKLGIAYSLNNHCIKLPGDCPQTDSNAQTYARLRRNSPKSYVFQTTDIRILHGYPKTKHYSAIEIQFYVTVPNSVTGLGNSTANPGTLAVFNPVIVKRSLEEESYLSSYGFQIVSVVLLKTRNGETSQTSRVSRTLTIVVAVLASLLLICFVVTALQCLRTRRLTSDRAAKGNSQKSNEENHEISLAVLPGSKENKHYENGEQESNRNQQQILPYQEIQITIPYDPNYVYPDGNQEGFYEPLQ